MRKFLPILLILGFVAVLSLVYFKPASIERAMSPQESAKPTVNSSSTNYSASFAIFTQGTFRIFTAAMYHNLSEDVFIQSDNPNIIHVKKSGMTWNDFFKTLPMELTKECLVTGTGQTFCTGDGQVVRFYLNDVEDPDALDRTIRSGDRLLVTVGKENESQIQKQLQQIPRQ